MKVSAGSAILPGYRGDTCPMCICVHHVLASDQLGGAVIDESVGFGSRYRFTQTPSLNCTTSAGDSVGGTEPPALVARGCCHVVRRGRVCAVPLLEIDVQRKRCDVRHGLTKRFAEHCD